MADEVHVFGDHGDFVLHPCREVAGILLHVAQTLVGVFVDLPKVGGGHVCTAVIRLAVANAVVCLTAKEVGHVGNMGARFGDEIVCPLRKIACTMLEQAEHFLRVHSDAFQQSSVRFCVTHFHITYLRLLIRIRLLTRLLRPLRPLRLLLEDRKLIPPGTMYGLGLDCGTQSNAADDQYVGAKVLQSSGTQPPADMACSVP
jgi:hypothetical protein